MFFISFHNKTLVGHLLRPILQRRASGAPGAGAMRAPTRAARAGGPEGPNHAPGRLQKIIFSKSGKVMCFQHFSKSRKKNKAFFSKMQKHNSFRNTARYGECQHWKILSSLARMHDNVAVVLVVSHLGCASTWV